MLQQINFFDKQKYIARIALTMILSNYQNTQMDFKTADSSAIKLFLDTGSLEDVSIDDLSLQGLTGYHLYFTAGSVRYLLHTTRGEPRVFKTLDAILSMLRDLGYQFPTISLKLEL